MVDYYILQGRDLVAADAATWSRWFADVRVRTVAYTTLPHGWGVVSTVCLGANHEYRPEEPPLVFESMVFAHDGAPPWMVELDNYQLRWSTYEHAECGHADLVESILMRARILGVQDRDPSSS